MQCFAVNLLKVYYREEALKIIIDFDSSQFGKWSLPNSIKT